MNAISEQIDSLFQAGTSTIARDLKLNLKKSLTESSLTAEESLLGLLAAATSVEHRSLTELAKENLLKHDLTQEQIQEASESAAIMGMLNTYYRFRHFIDNDEEYRAAALRMTALAKPLLGRERFEMLAFAVSVLNGCETCIKSHEKALRDAQVSVEKIHDLVRLASVVKGFKSLAKENL